MISTRGRYAIRIMIDLCEHSYGESISLHEMAERQSISEKYLEKIVRDLSKGNFIASTRGRHGGYCLTREPKSYTVGSILKLTEKNLAIVSCLKCESNPCDYSSQCRTLPMWKEFNEITEHYFESVTLDQLIK